MSDAGRPGRDLTNGPIATTLLAFALPTLASNILQSLNGSINAIWVGRFLGADALAATSNANLVMFLMFAAVFGFGMAATILVGQSYGRRDVAAARRVIGSGVTLLAGLATLIAVVGWFATPALLRLLATPAGAMPLALAYLRITFLFLPASMLSVLLMMGLRGTGDSVTPLIFMILSVLLDSGLNPVFILGLGPAPRLGIAGSATATLVASYASLVAMILYIYARDLPLRLRGAELRYLRPQVALIRTIVLKGLPMGAQMLVVSLGSLAIIGLVNRHGIVVTAAYGVTAQLWTYIQMPAMAIGAAVSAMAAQNIGADRWDRVGRVTIWGIAFNILITGAMVLLVTLADRPALALFLGAGSPALPIARHINLVTSWGFILFGITFVLSGTMRANGAVLGPLVILVVAIFPVRLGLVLALQPFIGMEALWWSFPAGFAASAAMAAGYYRFGGWRQARMATPADPQECENSAHAEADATGRMLPAARA